MKAELLKDDGFDSKLADIAGSVGLVEIARDDLGASGWTLWLSGDGRLVGRRGEDVVIIE